jgi:hypothetical protein
MITLTYPADFPLDGVLVKKHFELIRKWFVAHGVKGLWILEFQKRGAPHFHIFTPKININKLALSRIWYKIVGSGDIRHLNAGTRVEWLRVEHATASYCCKYASKMYQKEVPEGYVSVGRFWGLFGGLKAPREVVTGHLKDMAPMIRIIRNYNKVLRRNLNLNFKKDSGLCGFTTFNTAIIFQKYLSNYLDLGIV